MTLALTSLLVILPATLIASKVYGFLKWSAAARKTGLPWTWTPFLETEVVAMLLTPILRKLYFNHAREGNGWPDWCRFIIKDWSWEDKRRAHDTYGDVFLVVSPEGIICYSADAHTNWDVMNRRNDFTKPRDKYKILEPYGPNVATAEGQSYRFHVRVTAPPFGDMSGANDLVWNETMTQTRRLTECWAKEDSRNLEMDVNMLTLSVIALAGFGKKTNWTSSEKVPRDFKLTFLQAINDTTKYMVAILLIPKWLLRMTYRADAALAHSQLDQYMRSMIREQGEEIHKNSDYESEKARGNLLTSLLRSSANEGAAQANQGQKQRKAAFTEDEVMGNLFVYLLAGYETTANAIVYAITVLALHPEFQDKILAEIKTIDEEAKKEGRDELTYKDDFEKLEYTYAFMYETLRLFPGVTLITKMTEGGDYVEVSHPDNHESSPQRFQLPAQCRVYLSSPAVHYSERYWADPWALKPERWLASETLQQKSDENAAEKKIVAADRTRHMRGTFLTFSDGARACLGRKFAQSEFMAFLITLLRDYEIGLGAGSDPSRVEKDLYNISAGKVTLSPVEGIKLGLKKRQ